MYPLTFYVKSLGPDTAGEARGPVIRILEKYRHDEGTYQHELIHVRQWATFAVLSIPLAYLLFHFGLFDWMGFAVIPCAFHTALYRLVPSYRIWAEVEAYKVQAQYYPDDRRELFSYFVSKYYDLKVTESEVLAKMRKLYPTMTESDETQYAGRDRRSGTHEHLVASIITALKVSYPPPACLTDDEQRWVRMAIKDQADRASIRKAIIEKSLAGLVWSGLVGLGLLVVDYLKAHGLK